MLGFEAAPRHEIGLPALVFHGVDDPIVPPVAGETLAEELPRGEFVPVDGRHLARFEHGLAVTDRLVASFGEIEG
jgi:pimeloyl-ACP methyl ester carboxylesterase